MGHPGFCWTWQRDLASLKNNRKCLEGCNKELLENGLLRGKREPEAQSALLQLSKCDQATWAGYENQQQRVSFPTSEVLRYFYGFVLIHCFKSSVSVPVVFTLMYFDRRLLTSRSQSTNERSPAWV